MACSTLYSKYLNPCLAHRSALSNLQRYDYSFLNFIGDKSEAQRGALACPSSEELEVAELGCINRSNTILKKPVQQCLSTIEGQGY